MTQRAKTPDSLICGRSRALPQFGRCERHQSTNDAGTLGERLL